MIITIDQDYMWKNTYDIHNLALADPLHLTQLRQQPLIAKRTEVVDLQQNGVGKMQVFSQFPTNQEVKVQIHLLTVVDKLEHLSVGDLL